MRQTTSLPLSALGWITLIPGLGLLLTLLAVPVSLPAQVRITEFMAINNTVLQDEDGEYTDWLEIQNATPAVMSLEGWHLTDDPLNLTRWTFPAITLSPGEFLVIFASGKDRRDPAFPLHTSFKLDGDGEFLALIHPDGTTFIDSFSPEFPEQESDVAYGIPGEGGEPVFLASPTPGGSNTSERLPLLPPPIFSIHRGFFESPLTLSLSAWTQGAAIRYTLDGSTPTETHGTVYSQPIQIAKTSVVRAGVFASGFRPSKVVTHTYLFVDDVLLQSPIGQRPTPAWPPPGYYSGQLFDYGMDPNILNDPEYAPFAKQAMLDIPSVSLVTDLSNLFDPATGIYVNAEERGWEWERPVSVEYLHPDGTPGFQINGGIRIRGGWSRRGSNPKHNFRLYFRSEYGESRLRYRLFEDEGADEYKRLDIRTNQNFSWQSSRPSRAAKNTMVRDVVARDIQGAQGQPYTRSRAIHLYLNGVYWGLYQTQERPEAWFAETYMGGDRDEYDVVKPSRVDGQRVYATDGNLESWTRLWQATMQGLGNDTAYYGIQGRNPDGSPNPELEQLFEARRFADYMVGIKYTGDFDGPIGRSMDNQKPNNMWAIYNRERKDGFHFVVHDAEHVFTDMDGDTVGLDLDRTGPWPQTGELLWFNPQELQQALDDHPEYRMLLGDRAHYFLFNGGACTPDRVTELFNRRIAEIDLAIIAESARWGDAQGDPPRTKEDDWQPAVDAILHGYFPFRTEIVVEQFRNDGWYPPIDAPVYYVNGTYQHGGMLEPEDQLTIINPNGSGDIYYTLDGSDPRLPAPYNGDQDEVLVSEAAPKRAMVPQSSMPLGWTQPGFDDSGWTQGTGGVGYENDTGYEALIGLDIGSAMPNANETCLIRVPFTLSGGQLNGLNQMNLRVRYDDGFAAYLNGEAIANANAPSTLEWNSGADALHSDAEAVQFQEFDVTSAVGILQEGQNVIAIHGLNFGIASSDFLISCELTVRRDPSPGAVSPTAILYEGPVSITTNSPLQSRVFDGETWSALNVADYTVSSTSVDTWMLY